MEEWTRSLAGVLTAGAGLEQALIVTLRSAPAPIEPEVSTLVSRLHARWPTEEALRAFADDLDDATGDLIAAKLVLATRRRGPGLASVLESLAESVAADVRARRTVEADRDKPRATVRWITVITVVALTLLALNTSYIEPYRSPLGQLLLAVLLGIDVACLIWMRAMTRARPAPRFIGRGASELRPGAVRGGGTRARRSRRRQEAAMTATQIAAMAGALIALGVSLVVLRWLPAQPDLAGALDRLAPEHSLAPTGHSCRSVGPSGSVGAVGDSPSAAHSGQAPHQ